jgi:hypothetical protein
VPWPMARRTRTRSILHQTLNGFVLRDLGDERNLFCILTAAEINRGRLAMVVQFGQPLVTARSSSDDPLVIRIG